MQSLIILTLLSTLLVIPTIAQSLASLPKEIKTIRFSPNKTNEAYIVGFIQEAKVSLDILAYSFTNETIYQAVELVRKRNVKVRTICDKQQSQIKSAKCKDLGGRVDKASGLMHNKVIVRDGDCVLTGSFNFTNNAVYPNRENFIVICDVEVAKIYTDEFNRLWKENT
jgi:phosphatidylserine/phosphatidylglycerophosphate/cardiolipin synthase-like enzyme